MAVEISHTAQQVSRSRVSVGRIACMGHYQLCRDTRTKTLAHVLCACTLCVWQCLLKPVPAAGQLRLGPVHQMPVTISFCPLGLYPVLGQRKTMIPGQGHVPCRAALPRPSLPSGTDPSLSRSSSAPAGVRGSSTVLEIRATPSTPS